MVLDAEIKHFFSRHQSVLESNILEHGRHASMHTAQCNAIPAPPLEHGASITQPVPRAPIDLQVQEEMAALAAAAANQVEAAVVAVVADVTAAAAARVVGGGPGVPAVRGAGAVAAAVEAVGDGADVEGHDGPSRRVYTCQRCKKHGVQAFSSQRHRDMECPHRLCICELCQRVVTGNLKRKGTNQSRRDGHSHRMREGGAA